jgi:phosphoribosylaminoimidazolecarboxamide formyltransferase/IMP cyclohydrolase
VTSHYDAAIFQYFNRVSELTVFKQSLTDVRPLRYGENPHQKGFYYGDLNALFEQLSGKELSYNNLVDIDAAMELIKEFEEPTFAVIKHTNACGVPHRMILCRHGSVLLQVTLFLPSAA